MAIPDISGPEILRSLMEDHKLAQSDLPEIGSQGVLAETHPFLRGPGKHGYD